MNISEFTIKMYKLTLLFPKKEPLRYKIRAASLDVLSDLTAWNILNAENDANFIFEDDNQTDELIFCAYRDLNTLNNYLEVAKWQNWISYFEVLKIQQECAIIISNFKMEAKRAKQAKPPKNLAKLAHLIEKKEFAAPPPASNPQNIGKANIQLTERGEKILKILKEKGRAQVWEISELFPKISKRTIRRDFVELLEMGLIKRIGEKNNTFYELEANVGQ